LPQASNATKNSAGSVGEAGTTVTDAGGVGQKAYWNGGSTGRKEIDSVFSNLSSGNFQRCGMAVFLTLSGYLVWEELGK
jgi:hypothetical protein